ncbi:MAG: hypothetical protein S0880_00155 [Actinomycetota bacterium]|nr:hypothetical protein [Actinomycetota bacterium]
MTTVNVDQWTISGSNAFWGSPTIPLSEAHELVIIRPRPRLGSDRIIGISRRSDGEVAWLTPSEFWALATRAPVLLLDVTQPSPIPPAIGREPTAWVKDRVERQVGTLTVASVPEEGRLWIQAPPASEWVKLGVREMERLCLACPTVMTHSWVTELLPAAG